MPANVMALAAVQNTNSIRTAPQPPAEGVATPLSGETETVITPSPILLTAGESQRLAARLRAFAAIVFIEREARRLMARLYAVTAEGPPELRLTSAAALTPPNSPRERDILRPLIVNGGTHGHDHQQNEAQQQQLHIQHAADGSDSKTRWPARPHYLADVSERERVVMSAFVGWGADGAASRSTAAATPQDIASRRRRASLQHRRDPASDASGAGSIVSFALRIQHHGRRSGNGGKHRNWQKPSQSNRVKTSCDFAPLPLLLCALQPFPGDMLEMPRFLGKT